MLTPKPYDDTFLHNDCPSLRDSHDSIALDCTVQHSSHPETGALPKY